MTGQQQLAIVTVAWGVLHLVFGMCGGLSACILYVPQFARVFLGGRAMGGFAAADFGAAS